MNDVKLWVTNFNGWELLKLLVASSVTMEPRSFKITFFLDGALFKWVLQW